MIEELRKNIDLEISMLREISKYSNMLERSGIEERGILESSIESLRTRMKMINNSIPDIINELSPVKKLSEKNVPTRLEKVTLRNGERETELILNKKDREKFIKELSLNEKLLNKLKKEKGHKEKEQIYMGSRGYLKLSNKFFLDTARNLISEGKFRTLAAEVRRANLDMLIETYVAMMIFTSILSFFVALILGVFLLFFNLEAAWPFITSYMGPLGARMLKVIAVPIIIPIATFLFIYIYPSTEKGSIAKKIERELPFAAIHMSAISGSGIAPIEIFKIIGTSKDYPFLSREIRKVLNQINLYGYDLVTALNNVSKATPSTKLSELFSGLTTNINSGGSLKAFFEKRAETLLIDYRLEREKYTKVAETFMDIYITVVIAAPMILMLLIIMISMTGFQISITPGQMTFIIIAAISLLNIIFLGVLQAKQPGY
jgi:flagellar protein FlaJ